MQFANNRHLLILPIITVCIFFNTTTALASTTKSNTIEVTELVKCSELKTSKRKLKCFEALITSVAKIKSQPTLEQRVTENKIKEKKANFGLSEKQKNSKVTEQEINKIGKYQATVTKVVEGNYRILYFYTDKGHVWRQNEADHFWYPKKQSFKIEVVKGRLGEYQLKLAGKGHFTVVKRVR